MSCTHYVVSMHIDKRIEQMEKIPEMWGSREAIELSIIQMMEIELLVKNPKILDADSRSVISAWNNAKSTLTMAGPLPLHRYLEDYTNDLYFKELKKIIKVVRNHINEF